MQLFGNNSDGLLIQKAKMPRLLPISERLGLMAGCHLDQNTDGLMARSPTNKLQR